MLVFELLFMSCRIWAGLEGGPRLLLLEVLKALLSPSPFVLWRSPAVAVKQISKIILQSSKTLTWSVQRAQNGGVGSIQRMLDCLLIE